MIQAIFELASGLTGAFSPKRDEPPTPTTRCTQIDYLVGTARVELAAPCLLGKEPLMGRTSGGGARTRFPGRSLNSRRAQRRPSGLRARQLTRTGVISESANLVVRDRLASDEHGRSRQTKPVAGEDLGNCWIQARHQFRRLLRPALGRRPRPPRRPMTCP